MWESEKETHQMKVIDTEKLPIKIWLNSVDDMEEGPGVRITR